MVNTCPSVSILNTLGILKCVVILNGIPTKRYAELSTMTFLLKVMVIEDGLITGGHCIKGGPYEKLKDIH
jgi:hypothetical protein